MSESAHLQHRIDDLLDTGLRNLWYPVLPSWAVRDTNVGITRLGENIVLWRDRDGSVHALEDRCPHRGARLSLGWNLGDRVACWYHGVEVDQTGTVRDVPALKSCAMVGESRVRRYPVREIRGAIFLYFGDALHPEPTAFEPPEELTDEQNWGAMLCTAAWRCNYRYAIDNVMDPMHGAYLHAASHSMAHGDKTAEMRVRKTQTGLIFEKVNQRDVNFDWVEFGDTGANWLRLSIPYRRSAGPGGSFGIVGFVTPIDRDHCRVFFWRTRKVAGWQRDVWRFMYRNRLEGLHWEVLEQDRVVLESMAPQARDHEYLYQHDVGLSHVRRLLRTRAREQVEALDHAAQAH
jgi:phenylpropionate dioxygenase-like ring-hydroxylating dioxygenase large terminal subunit